MKFLLNLGRTDCHLFEEMMKNLMQSIEQRKIQKKANSVSSTCAVSDSFEISVTDTQLKELVLHLPEKDYLQLSQLAMQYCLTPAEYVKRRTFGRRMPRFIGTVLEQIVQTLVRIEEQLEKLVLEISDNSVSRQQNRVKPELRKNLHQLSILIKRLDRQFKL